LTLPPSSLLSISLSHSHTHTHTHTHTHRDVDTQSKQKYSTVPPPWGMLLFYSYFCHF
jgi:hypothetical protein